MLVWPLALWLATLPASAQGVADAARGGDAVVGRRLYDEGRFTDGRPLVGLRTDGVRVSGAQAACAQCHRASGMGGAEGTVLIPPIAGPLLFAPAQADQVRTPRRASGMQRTPPASLVRGAYTLASLQRALVDGHGPDGAVLGYLMPRYALSATDLRDLAAHLDTLSVGPAPGIDGQHLWLATVVADSAPAEQRRAVVDILQRCVAERSPRGGHDSAGRPILPWRLDVWTLQGPPDGWPAQLAEHARRRPAFALLSGLTGDTWAPVQRFCEANGIPCAYPNTVAVDPAAPSHWTMHLSLGVAAEVAALVEHLPDLALPGTRPRVRQVVGDGEAARLAARLLRERLSRLGWPMADDEAPGPATGMARAAAGAMPDDLQVLWLEPEALARHTASTRPPLGPVVLSGALGGLEAAPLSPAWRADAHMLYPYEPADRRVGRIVLNAGGWMQRNGLALTAELSLLQGNTYSACEMASRALQMMRGRTSREYFMELLEASAEGALATGFPRFTLGAHQRQGSRGAYVMRYDPTPPEGGRVHLRRTSDWLTER